MKKIHEKRWLKLINHLRNGKLGHKYFTYYTVNHGEPLEKYKKNKRLSNCRTNGCAVGELPFIFKDFAFADKANSDFLYSSLTFKGDLVTYCGDEVSSFFGVSKAIINCMFTPDKILILEKDKKIEIESPIDFASKEMVADHLEKILNLLKEGYNERDY